MNDDTKQTADVIKCMVDPPLPHLDPSDHQVCCISLAWKESSLSGIFWWMAWHPLYQGHSHRSPHHPQVQSRTLNSVSADLPLTCEQQHFVKYYAKKQPQQNSISVQDEVKHVLPVANEVRFFKNGYILHSLTVHFFTDFINSRLRSEINCCYWVTERDL